jgi:hypothetical protein
VRAEGESRAGRVKFRELCLDSLSRARRDLERAEKLVEQQLYQPEEYR